MRLQGALTRRLRESSTPLCRWDHSRPLPRPPGARLSNLNGETKESETAIAAQWDCVKSVPPISFVSKFKSPLDYSDTLLAVARAP
jgi:hypothetical protein